MSIQMTAFPGNLCPEPTPRLAVCMQFGPEVS